MTETSQNRKKLIEVALPLEAINKASSSEKSVRQGHPSTMHLWWARRPLAACRAVLFASIIDDPSNSLPEKEAKRQRERLFKLIEKMVLWKNIDNESVLKEVRREIQKQIGSDTLAILDPFCGGGSIPIEAQRLGLSAYASDLNPVAVMITKAMIEIPPRFSGKPPVNLNALEQSVKGNYKGAEGLAADVEHYGNWIRMEAEKQIGSLYPKINNKQAIAWIWARTVKCPNPACGAEMPLVRSFDLAKNEGKKAWVEPVINKKNKSVSYEVRTGTGRTHEGTVNRKGAYCIVCKSPVPLEYIRSEGKARRIGKRMMSIIIEGERGPSFSSPLKEHIDAANNARPKWYPETPLPEKALGFRVQGYGMTKHKDLFTSRQLAALTTFSDLVSLAHDKILSDAIKAGLADDNKGFEEGGTGALAYADAVSTYLAFAVDRCADYWSSLTVWADGFIAHTFGRQTLQMVWDFSECNPFSDSTGNWQGATKWIAQCLRISVPAIGIGKVMQLDAARASYPNISPIFCTDPPYYDNIGYADLSDFFYIWLRNSLGKFFPQIFSTMLSPKDQELIANPYRFGENHSAHEYFLVNLQKAFELIRKNQDSRYPITVFYAFKETEEIDDPDGGISSPGWETILSSMINAGLQITGTWPMRTERKGRLRDINSNALASSIVLVCRVRPIDAPLATRREFLSVLKKELPAAVTRLQHINIAPVDLAQASIGPGMAIFSRYSKILEANGSQMTVKTALQIINQELDLFMTTQEGELDQETRFCLAWFNEYGFNAGPFGQADVLAKAKNTSTQHLSNCHLIKSTAGKVRLIRYSELPANLDLSKQDRLTIWLCMLELIRKLESGGEDEAAKAVLRIGAGLSEAVKDLTYRLYSTCEKKGWAEEALVYNNLVSSWSTIQEKAGLGSVPVGQTRL